MSVEKRETSDGRSLRYGRWLASPKPGEEIVISGLSAEFPSCSNAYEIKENLYKKLDLINGESRWIFESSAMPARVGLISGVKLFDCSAFGMTPHTADLADPLLRTLLENSIEAILDAGINPEDLVGTRTATIGCVCSSETGDIFTKENFIPDKHGVLVASRAAANILSYNLKVNGPSTMCNSACSSTAYALDLAYKLIRRGECDAALVFSSGILCDPRATSQFYSLGVLSPDGVCKPFDESADGYVRSEARCAVFLQKAIDAKRIYGQLVHAKTNCDGFKPEGITFPSGPMQQVLLEEVYAECGFDPKDLYFMEAHGTGTKVGDPEELNSIDRVFCKNRKEPLLIGSVKGNLGHTEHVSALASLVKILLGMEASYIAPNIHFKAPRGEIPAFKEGRLKVPIEKLPYKDQNALVGISSYGFGGANGHLILRGFNNREKKLVQFDGLPRLVCFGGRTEATIKNILKDLIERKYDPEYIALLHPIFRKSSSLTHPYRGFAIVSDKSVSKTFYQKQKSCNNKLFAIFSGFEDGWLHIGQKLIKLPLFKSTLERANKIFSQNGTDITQSLITEDSQFPSKPLLNFVVQLGILDIFKVLELRFAKIISVSFGKILAAYYQETITLEEALNVATVLENFTNPSRTSNNKPIRVQQNNMLTLQKELDKQFPTPKHNPFDAQVLLNTKLPPFIKLPKEGTILEFGFGHFTATANGAISDLIQVVNFASNESDGFATLLAALGRLYVSGFDLNLEKLYPAVQYPVSRGTPMISPLVAWEHSLKQFKVKEYGTKKSAKRSETVVTIDVSSSEWSFITGHIVDGRILFPATGYLYVVWKELATLHGLKPEEAKVIFENVRFKRATHLTPTSVVELLVTIFEKSGYFEIYEGGTGIVTGFVKLVIHDPDTVHLPLSQTDPSLEELKQQDVYKELKLRGYNYNGLFKAIKKLDQSFSQAHVQWFKNWVSFMDNMLQLSILGNDTRNLYVPTAIDRIVINSVKHVELLEKFEGPEPLLPAYMYHDINYCRSRYIEIYGAKTSSIPKRKQLRDPVLEKYQFIPNEACLTTEEALRVNIQIALENRYRLKVKTVEVFDSNSKPLSPTVLSILGDIPFVEPDVNILTNKKFKCPGVNLVNRKLITETDAFIVFGVNVLSIPQLLKDALAAVNGGYILTRQTTTFSPETLVNNKLEVLTSYKTENGLQLLLCVVEEEDAKPSAIIKIANTCDDFSWLQPLQNALKFKQNVILLAQNEATNGILGLFNCIRQEYKTLNIRCVFILDEAPAFDPSIDFYKQHLKKQFAVNIFKDGKWGTYRHLLLDESPSSDSEHAYVNTLRKGDLSTLKWIEGPLQFNSPAEIDQKLVQVYYASLNFRDIMTATGKISAHVITSYRPEQECVQGFEFVGKDMKGRRVMGMKAGGALSSIVMADKTFLIPVPDNWTLEDAATVPVVYGTVLYALVYRAGMKRGQSILIHAGTGGIGQAAIRIALHYGLHVYTTVGTEAKRQFIKDTFPQISDQQIGNSRDVSFEQFIMKQTKGRGVDLVLNSLAEEKLQASVRCVARGGHFVEIGKFDLSQDSPLPLKCFARGISHHGIMLDSFFVQPTWIKRFLMDIIKKEMQIGTVQPLHRVVFQRDQIEEAFRYMAAGKHVGKVLIQLRKEDESPQFIKTKCSPRYFCNSEYTQVIVGGLGGFGFELADWLVLRGAKKLVLTSRTGVKNGYQASRLRLWRSYGVDVIVSTANAATKNGCLELLRVANKLGPIESLFNVALVLQDAVFENQSERSFATPFDPKAIATAYLDEITRKHCSYLRTFVVFSSLSCGRGNAGQTNYAMANSVMERMCEIRKQDGLPALAIQWSILADVGLLAEMQRGDVEIEMCGTVQQRLASCLQVLDQFLRQNEPVVSSMVVAEKRLGAKAGGNIVSAVANVLGIKDLKTISLQTSLAELGMDSMMSVEVKHMIETELNVVLPSRELRDLSFRRLQEMMEDGNREEIKTREGYD